MPSSASLLVSMSRLALAGCNASALAIEKVTAAASGSSRLSVSDILPPAGAIARLISSETCSEASTKWHRQWTPPEPPLAPGRRRLPLVDSEGRVMLKGLPFLDLQRWCATQGFGAGRAAHLWRVMYDEAGAGATCWREARDLGLMGRSSLAEMEPVARLDGGLQLLQVLEATDGTKKLIFRAESGNSSVAPSKVEGVLIPMGPGNEGRKTVCVSSQVGCAMNCKFCLTGRMGLLSDLNTAQIVEQFLVARKLALEGGDPAPVGNVVFMGMGEPLSNLPAVGAALSILTAQPGIQLAPSRITVSTSGLLPELRQLTASHPKVQVAVSLNATTDDIRSRIMPINRKWPLQKLTATLRELFPADLPPSDRPQRRSTVLLEYIILRGVNDTLEDAQRIVKLTEGVACKLNLIEFNSHEGTAFQGSDTHTVQLFREALEEAGLFVTVRRSKGEDTMAACGQLGGPALLR